MIKSLKKNDIRTTPFTAAKKWNPQNKLHKDLILWQSGSVSGSLTLTFKEYNDGTVAPYTYISSAIALQQQEDDFLRFREGINLTGSISPTGSFYYDPILSEKNIDGTYKTVLYATTKHLFYKESQDPSKIFGLESLDSSNVNRSLPNKISTFNIPQNKFGEKVLPKSVVIKHEIQGQTYSVVDDGNSNLVVSDKTFINNQDSTIDKVAANITLNNADKNNTIYTVYNGSPKTVTATTSPNNLSYYVTYDGSRTPPTNVGVYKIVATIDDNFYTGTITGTLVIIKSPVTITISNLTQTYDGNPKSATVSISTVNVNYIVTYNGSTTLPSNVGTYTVNVTINDANYDGKKTATLTIEPQTLSITTQCPSKTYGDDDFTIPVNTVSNGAISYTINSGPATIVNGKIHITDVGTLNVTINQAKSGDYAAASVNCSSITISPKQLTVTGITAADKAYDGSNLATVNATKAALQGVVTYPNGRKDDVTLSGTAGGTFSDSSVGEGKTVTISGLNISGTAASKYTLVQPTTIASIKDGSASGTITMNSATVTYNGNPRWLNVTVDTNIPIKITYRDGNNNIITLIKLYKGITSVEKGRYPSDIGLYNVTAELDTDISTGIKYTVSTVNATLNIIPIQGDVIFGPNIFYFDRKPKPVQILSTSPIGKDLTIKYDGSSTVPSAVGTYKVNVKFKDSHIYFDKDVDLTIKEIPSNSCGGTKNITNETNYQQYQKNIINLQSVVGNVNFNYYINQGASQFTIEYPLNSGKIVYDSGLRSKEYSVGTTITDYVSKNTIVITGIQNPENNVPISFYKSATGIDSDKGINNDKCLVTVYSPTNNNSWNYSVSCIDVPPPKIDDLQNVNIDLSYTWPINDFSAANAKLGVLLLALQPELKVKLDGGSITQFEYDAILRIISSNHRLPGANSLGYTLTDTNSNIKVNVVKYTGVGEYTEVNLSYMRVSNSLAPLSDFGTFVVDCHRYKYLGKNASFNVDDAISALKSQINSDSFQDTFITLNNTITNGEIQRKSLLSLLTQKNLSQNLDNTLFRFTNDTNNQVPGILYVSNDSINTTSNTDISGILTDGLIYVNTTEQIVEIVYPSICQPINFGQHN